MKSRISIIDLLHLHLFIFIFSMVNREFLFLGIDLRYIQMIFTIIILCCCKLQMKKSPPITRLEKLLIIFYIFLFISNFYLLLNNNIEIIEEEKNELINLNILHINNFLCFLVFINFKDQIKWKLVVKFLKIAIFILFLSCVMIFLNIQISDLFTTGARMIVNSDTNMFGGHRIAGFAEDPNYAFLFFYTCVLVLISSRKKILDFFIVLISLMGIGVSFSKTQMLAIFPSLIAYTLFVKFPFKKSLKKIFVSCVLILIFSAPLIFLYMNIFVNMDTMSTRYLLWIYCLQMLSENFFFPTGLGSCRFYIDYINNYQWSVQSHSTYIQILCEFGIINLVLIYMVFKRLLVESRNITFLIFLNFLFFSVTYETIYLQYFIFVIYIIPLLYQKRKECKVANFK